MSANKNFLGFTFVEILASLLIMSVFTTIALTGLTNVVDEAKFSQTQREIEQLRAALVGETQRLETGLRRNYGYYGDVGALPTSSQGLGALSSKPSTVSSWAISVGYGIASGWRGPYLENTIDQDFFKDAWGNDYIYTNSGGIVTISSYGSDGVVGGSGYASDITVSIPAAVTSGTIYGYVVMAGGAAADVVGADQVPFSSSAQAVIFYPNGTGGFSSQIYTMTPASSGKYTFSNLPLGYGAVRIHIPTIASASGNNILGPTIVEINKAATAVVPVARDTSNLYGSVAGCTNSENFTISSASYSKDNTARTLAFAISFPADYTWGGTGSFYNEQEGGAVLTGMTIVNTVTSSSFFLRSSGGMIRISSAVAGFTNIATNNSATMSSFQFLSNTNYRLIFSYSASNWLSDHSVYYYQIGCKFLRAHPGM